MPRHNQKGAAPGGSQRQLRVGEAVRHAIADILAQASVHDPDLEGHINRIVEEGYTILPNAIEPDLVDEIDESLLKLETWADLVAENPILGELEPDVEALLINRAERAEAYYRVPIDECYKLVGLIRKHWRGFSGGTEAREAIEQFFVNLKERSSTVGEGARA